ncbi:Six-hairpin glycosidase-like protein [Talaromyces proteolyticus]|uniref:Six-hairpin glycosidase-like protein n=1 Tax=Talaromyces proteolyticus TaxID=1131652 RepID=A0AAD4KKK7_9EURO|nr:Six-hairpin glycosidase-like protein [Talaromyces proteolyticus]KAH8691381.1 Six-hairpin glycosidase-like protein [Talaromyces proteolyticus]
MVSPEEQKIVNELQANWIWTPNWVDSSDINTAGRVVKFTRKFSLPSRLTKALLHFSADTRYKLYVNGARVAVGPSRSSPLIWYYDTLDIAPYLNTGDNEVVILVIRYFASSRGAMPFERTAIPGLTVVGRVHAETTVIDLSSSEGWEAQVENSISFPMGLVDDVFLHISERITPSSPSPSVKPITHATSVIRLCEGDMPVDSWNTWLSGSKPLSLSGNSSYNVELKAEVHSTAFVRWAIQASKQTRIRLKITYSEGYELEPRSYPFFRTKADRLDETVGHLIGPYDDVILDLPAKQTVIYEPFWFRTFRIMRLEITVGSEPVELLSFDVTQINYPLAVKATWNEPEDANGKQIWDVSIRTMRNCMFDGYSDCPFYEQLQYSGDSRSVGLFHYLLSGDDRLMRQAITNFASSVTTEGLTQSRFPSHVPQIIAGFSLYWILQICDHHLFFGDTRFSRSFLPRIDGVLDFFDAHVNDQGLISGLPEDVWQYVDWVTTWGATDDHPDKGVPTSGRKSNCHTYFSMLYAYVLKQAARLVREVGRPGHASEYEDRAASLLSAIRNHCYDGQFFTDSTADIADDLAYSQHCQVFAILSGAAEILNIEGKSRLLTESFSNPRFSKCSYMMQFYALRAFALAGDEVYEDYWQRVWNPWRKMLENNLSTWEEDDVRQRSDCHAWGSVPIYEYCTELAGIHPIAPGSTKVLFKPRLRLSNAVDAKVALGKDNLASVSWKIQDGGERRVELRLERGIEVLSQLPGGEVKEHGIVDHVELIYKSV